MHKSGWLIDRMVLRRADRSSAQHVPVFTCIKPGKTREFLVKDVALPQNVPHRKDRREEDLEEKRKEYQLTPILKLKDGKKKIAIPMMKKLPKDEEFEFGYELKILGKGLTTEISGFFEGLFGGKGEFDSIDDIVDIYKGVGNFFKQPVNTER